MWCTRLAGNAGCKKSPIIRHLRTIAQLYGWDRFVSLGHTSKFQQVSHLGSVTARHSQQFSAAAHRARETVELLSKETPEFIPPSLRPPNNPDLSRVDYSIWQVMQDWVYQETIENVDQLKQRIVTAWNELDQRAVDQWRKRLQMCVRSDGSYFEHLPWHRHLSSMFVYSDIKHFIFTSQVMKLMIIG